MQQDDLIGKMLGNYRVLEALGQGGMARVYKAHQENLGRDVAIKVLPPWYAADRSFVERFNLEARLVARLSHPNIVTVHDANEQNGHLYIVMQLVDGGTLKHRMDRLQHDRRFMEPAEVVSVFGQLANALAYAHDHGIIHRDIKPVNVLMDRSGRPILSDFGIAKVLASTQDNLTRPGAGVGTPEYMSPEQCQGGDIDRRADIYAMGVLLFETQTGRTPFRGNNYPALAHSHIYEAPPLPRSINPTIPVTIEQIILRALQKVPRQRFQTAQEMRDALTQALKTIQGQQQVNQMGTIKTTGSGSNYYGPPGLAPYTRGLNISTESRSALLYTCFNCQNLNKPQMRFCTRCGFLLNKCTICGNPNPASNRFCTKCGQPLAL
jgi:serine/threonine protein kinase